MAVSTPSFPPVRACIFDMDGLLIDSEDIYTVATNEVLHKYGRPSLPWSIKAQLQGRPGSEATKIFHAWAQLPISIEEYRTQLLEIQARLFPSTQPLPGVETLLSILSKSTTAQGAKFHISLATSSHAGNYKIKTSHLTQLFEVFPPSQRVLGDDPRIPSGKGKPFPDIYLLALSTINDTIRSNGGDEPEIRPEECLVFEDSVPGIEAGRRAGMRVIWCPHPGLRGEFAGREAVVLAGMGEGGSEPEGGEVEGHAVEMGGAEQEQRMAELKGWPGKPGDGWGAQLATLEHFDHAKYGIEVPRENRLQLSWAEKY